MPIKNIYRDAEHPFAEYVRILGKGKRSQRSFTVDEARSAFGMILDGQVLDVQLGAFLMLLRVKEESTEELAGFVMAVRDRVSVPEDFPVVDIDWSSYAGKRKHYPWFLLAVRVLAQQGLRILMHGAAGHTLNRLYTEQLCSQLGLPVASNWQQAAEQLQQMNFSYMPLHVIHPLLEELIQLRNVMGLRSPVHTIARLINPANAGLVMQGIFHPAYRAGHRDAGLQLGYQHLCVIKGEGGEIERNPDGSCLSCNIVDGEASDEEWPALFGQRHDPVEAFDLQHYVDVWQGTKQDEYGEMAVIGTLALVLRALKKTPSQTEALEMARAWWLARYI